MVNKLSYSRFFLKMEGRKLLATFVANFLLAHASGEGLSVVLSEPVVVMAEPVQTVPAVKQPSLLTIDLSKCVCSRIAGCELTILKSSLMNVTCKADEGLCCPVKVSPLPEAAHEALENNEEIEVEAPRSNVRVYSISSMSFKDYSDSRRAEAQKKPTKSCSCKSRNSCPPKYIDYGFGFYCSYSTVRCCIPEGTLEVEPEAPSTPQDDEGEANQDVDAPTFVGEQEDSRDVSVEAIEESVSILAEEQAESHSNEETNADSIFIETDGENAMRTLIEAEESESEQPVSVQIVDNVPIPEPNTSSSSGDVDQPDEIYRHPYMGDLEEEEEAQLESEKAHAGAARESDLVITEVTDWTDLEEMEDDFHTEPDCRCLPIHKCVMSGSYDTNNMIERRRDTVCPGGLIQCCGKDLEITKKNDEVAEYDGSIESHPVESPIPITSGEGERYAPSSIEYAPANYSSYSPSPATPQVGQTIPASSVLPVPYPGYQPPGFYKGYNYQPNPSAYNPSSQPGPALNTQYFRNGQPQETVQSQYDMTGTQQVYRPWVYSKYSPPHNGAAQPGGLYYNSESPRERTGGLLETLTKYLG